jgi:hypothetical protein
MSQTAGFSDIFIACSSGGLNLLDEEECYEIGQDLVRIDDFPPESEGAWSALVVCHNQRFCGIVA